MKNFSSFVYGARRARGVLVGILLVAVVFALLFTFVSCAKKETSDAAKQAEVIGDFKTEYYVGEELVVGGSLKMYSDMAAFSVIPITSDMISGFDTSAPGDVLVRVTYGEYTATIPIRVIALTIHSISIDEDTLPVGIYKGSSFPSMMTLTARMSDGSMQTGIPVLSSMISGFDSSRIGAQTITVSYHGVSASFSLSILEDVRSAITLVGAKDYYPFGEEEVDLADSLSNAVLEVRYASGNVYGVTPTADMISDFSLEIGGERRATVTYNGLTCDYVYFVQKPVSMTLVGARDTYAVNEPLTAEGGHLEVTYNDEEVKSVPFTADLVSGFSTALGGEYEATVVYAGLECDYAYTVRKEITGFALILDELPILYEKGDPFPDIGFGVLTYNDGTEGGVSYSSDQVLDFDTSIAGNYTAHIIVAGFSAEYAYTVLPEIESALIYGYTPAVVQDAEFDGLGELIVVYETGERESIALTSDRLSVTYVTDRVGDITQRVLFRRANVTFDVTVYAASDRYSVESIELLGSFSPIKIGDPIDTEGVQVRVVYRYLTPTITSCDPSWVSVVMPDSIEGDAETLPVTVSCFGAETTGSVRVLSEEYASRVTSLTPIGFKTLYVLGDPLSLENATLAVTFGGGYDLRQGVPVEADYITDFNTSMTGGKSMTVTYGGYSVSVDYRVISSEVKDRVTDLMIYGFDPLLFEGDNIFDIDVSHYTLALTLGYGYSEAMIPLSAEMLSGGPFSEAGSAEVTVTYAEVSRNFSVHVRPESDRSVVTSISVPDMIRAYVGTTPDFSAANLEVTCGYGYEKRTIPLSSEGVSVSPYSTASEGYVRVEVTYAGVTCDAILSFIAGGSENLLQNISISEDSRSEFTVGEALEGVYLVLMYNGDRRPEKVAVNVATMASDFTSAEAGKYTITISYGGRAVVYTYTVTEGEGQEG